MRLWSSKRENVWVSLPPDCTSRKPSPSVRVYYTVVWAHSFGWLVGPKVTKCHKTCRLPEQSQKPIVCCIIMWQGGFEKIRWIAGMEKSVGVVHTTHNNTGPSWRLIQSQHVPFWGCCQAQVCSVTLWGRGNYILVQSGDSASIQKVLSVPSSYRPQPPEECPALDTLLWTNSYTELFFCL